MVMKAPLFIFLMSLVDIYVIIALLAMIREKVKMYKTMACIFFMIIIHKIS